MLLAQNTNRIEQRALEYFHKVLLPEDSLFNRCSLKYSNTTTQYFTSSLIVYHCKEFNDTLSYKEVEKDFNSEPTSDTTKVKLIIYKKWLKKNKGNCIAKVEVTKALKIRDFYYVQIRLSKELMGCDYIICLNKKKVANSCKGLFVR